MLTAIASWLPEVSSWTNWSWTGPGSKGIVIHHLSAQSIRISFFSKSDLSGKINRVSSIRAGLEDEPLGIWLSGLGDLFYAGKFESAHSYGGREGDLQPQ